MSPQNIVAMTEVLRKQGHGAEVVTNDVGIQPSNQSFANRDALKAYVVETFGATRQNGGVSGGLARKGNYVRRSADGARTITFGNPVLDAIASASGSLVVGGHKIDLTTLAGDAGAGTGVVAFDASALKKIGVVNDAEKWALDDNSYVEYRIGNARLGFQAWRHGPSVPDLGFWHMGVGISVWNTRSHYESALVQAINYMSDNAPCREFPAGGKGQNTDYNGDHVDLSDYGMFLIAQQPERVAGICMARWHHRQFSDVVTAGSGCPAYATAFDTITFPADWAPISTLVNLNGNWTDGSSRNAVVSVSRRSLSIDMSAFGRPAASGTVDGYTEITATFPDDKTYKGRLTGNAIQWSNGSEWRKVINTAFDLNGSWTDGSPWIADIFEGPVALRVDMSDFERPNATGKIVDSSTITVTFPDDHAYTGTLIAPNTIRWSNGSTWTKKGV